MYPIHIVVRRMKLKLKLKLKLTYTNSEFVKCFLLAVAEEDKIKTLQDVSLEDMQGPYMNLERLCLNSINCRQSPFIVYSQWMKEITS